MAKLDLIVSLAVLITILALSMPSSAVSPVDKTVEVTATIPEEIIIDLDEAEDGISLSPIYPGPGVAEGRISILSTGPWMLTAKDGTAGGDGRMRTSDGHVLFRKHQIKLGSGSYKDLAGNSGYNLMKIGLLPGSYIGTTYYRQYFTVGDYAGTDYNVFVMWECSATFD